MKLINYSTTQFWLKFWISLSWFVAGISGLAIIATTGTIAFMMDGGAGSGSWGILSIGFLGAAFVWWLLFALTSGWILWLFTPIDQFASITQEESDDE